MSKQILQVRYQLPEVQLQMYPSMCKGVADVLAMTLATLKANTVQEQIIFGLLYEAFTIFYKKQEGKSAKRKTIKLKQHVACQLHAFMQTMNDVVNTLEPYQIAAVTELMGELDRAVRSPRLPEEFRVKV